MDFFLLHLIYIYIMYISLIFIYAFITDGFYDINHKNKKNINIYCIVNILQIFVIDAITFSNIWQKADLIDLLWK